jgi:hypothetical protein
MLNQFNLLLEFNKMDPSADASDIQLAILKELQKLNANVQLQTELTQEQTKLAQEQTKLLRQQDATNVLVRKPWLMLEYSEASSTFRSCR